MLQTLLSYWDMEKTLVCTINLCTQWAFLEIDMAKWDFATVDACHNYNAHKYENSSVLILTDS